METIGDDWTLHGWLVSTPDVVASIASALRSAQQATAPTHDLEHVLAIGTEGKALGDGRELILEVLRAGSTLEVLAGAIWNGIERLMDARAVTPSALQAKFLQDGVGLLSYSGLDAFFSGLEGLIGSPRPHIRQAMAAEHNERGDSQEWFVNNNYNITTNSDIEWRFVAEPDNEPTDGWPIEKRLQGAREHEQCGLTRQLSEGSLALLASGACFREPMSRFHLLAVLHARMKLSKRWASLW